MIFRSADACSSELPVISIPALLIRMANFTRSHTIINASFKGLSIFAIAIAVTRLALQYDSGRHRVDYMAVTFWLTVEAAIALIMASISSYRVPLLDYLAERRLRQSVGSNKPTVHMRWLRVTRDYSRANARTNGAPPSEQLSLSDIPMVRHPR